MAPNSPVRIPIGRAAPGVSRNERARRLPQARLRRPVYAAGFGGASAAAKKPACGPVGVEAAPGELHLEGARHADAVLVHREIAVRCLDRERAVGHEVVLVGGEDHAMPDGVQEHVLPVLDRVDHRLGFVGRVQPHRRFLVELAQSERHDGDGFEIGILVEHAGHRAIEDLAVVHAGAQHDLAAHDDAVVEQGTQPAQAHAAAWVLQHARPHIGIGGVDADVQR